MSPEDLTKFDTLKRDHHNTHAILVNMWPKSPVESISEAVNHLASLIVWQWLSQAMIHGELIDMNELRKALKWQGNLIKKFQKEKRSLYFIRRSDNDIIFWRTKSLIRDYFILVDKLLNASATFGTFLEQLSLEVSSPEVTNPEVTNPEVSSDDKAA